MDKKIAEAILKDAVVSIKVQRKTDRGLWIRIDAIETPIDTTFAHLLDRML